MSSKTISGGADAGLMQMLLQITHLYVGRSAYCSVCRLLVRLLTRKVFNNKSSIYAGAGLMLMLFLPWLYLRETFRSSSIIYAA